MTDSLGMSKVSARWEPRMLTKDQKKSWLGISKYLLYLFEDDSKEFMRRVVNQDNAKKQSMQWKHPGSPPPEKSLYLLP